MIPAMKSEIEFAALHAQIFERRVAEALASGTG
jgi:hypothetical protein